MTSQGGNVQQLHFPGLFSCIIDPLAFRSSHKWARQCHRAKIQIWIGHWKSFLDDLQRNLPNIVFFGNHVNSLKKSTRKLEFHYSHAKNWCQVAFAPVFFIVLEAKTYCCLLARNIKVVTVKQKARNNTQTSCREKFPAFQKRIYYPISLDWRWQAKMKRPPENRSDNELKHCNAGGRGR